MARVRVLVAEDEQVLREALVDLLCTDGRIEVVAQAVDAQEAIELAESLLPDVALVDVKMPRGGGGRAAREIRIRSPQTHILALSAYDDRASVLDMVRSGAVGYLVKGTSAGDIVDAIHRAVLGQSSLSSEVAGEVVYELAGKLQEQRLRIEKHQAKRERIRRLIEAEGPAIVFQPIVDIRTGVVAGAEALSRFAGPPDQGPAAWFADASEVGLRMELELRVVRTALGRLPELPPAAYLSLNLSPETAGSAALIDALREAPTERLVIEITEHAEIEDYEALGAALRPVRETGVRLAVDDAGAGFASLRHILQLDPDIIKLDISLTRGVDHDRARRALASALIAFASEMAVAIMAEGIETREELEALRTLGVSHGQGSTWPDRGRFPWDRFASIERRAQDPSRPRPDGHTMAQ